MLNSYIYILNIYIPKYNLPTLYNIIHIMFSGLITQYWVTMWYNLPWKGLFLLFSPFFSFLRALLVPFHVGMPIVTVLVQFMVKTVVFVELYGSSLWCHGDAQSHRNALSSGSFPFSSYSYTRLVEHYVGKVIVDVATRAELLTLCYDWLWFSLKVSFWKKKEFH